jgi:hypothetical protein
MRDCIGSALYRVWNRDGMEEMAFQKMNPMSVNTWRG